MQSDSYVKFGPFRLKVGTGLWRHDDELLLPPKEMALLELLVQSRGEVVRHEAIYKYLWPRQSVGYPSLARCVYSLRKALGPEGNDLIKTVPKRGYKLAVPAERRAEQDHLSAIKSTVQTQPLARAHYQAGLASASNPGAESLERALHWFKASVQADPDYAAAHAALAEVRLFQSLRGYIHPHDALRMGLDSCNAALRSDPHAVRALGAHGWFTALIGGNLEQGIKSVEYARQLDPKFSQTYAYQSWIHRAQGAPEAALECTLKAVELDPHAVFNRHAHAVTLFFAGNSAEALKQENWVLENYPSDDIAPGYQSIFLASLGRQEEALDAAYQALGLSQHVPSTWGAIAWCMAVCGEPEEALRLVKEAYAARLPRCPRPLMVPALLALGKTDRAFALLHEAREEHCPWFHGVRIDPRLAALRDDKRWHSLYS